MYQVILKRKILKNISKMPLSIQEKMAALIDDLKEKGAEHPNWPNYSKINKNEYHCHLSYKWVACWRHEKSTIIIEVYYAGSRENAPY